jgi:hypothetical protein
MTAPAFPRKRFGGLPATPVWSQSFMAPMVSAGTSGAKGGIDENTNFPAWDGTPVDYDATLSALWECRQR